MAILFTDGFDNYGSTTGTNLLTRWTSSIYPDRFSTSVTPYNYGQSHGPLLLDRPSTVTFTATSTITVGANCYFTQYNDLLWYPLYGLMSSGTWMIGLAIRSDGSIAVSRQLSDSNAVVIATSSTNTLKINTWNYIELSVTISDTVGTVRVDVDGQTVINATGLDTRNGTPTTVNMFVAGTNNASAGGGVYFDDLYISDSITPLGPRRIYTLRPNADTAEKDWSPTSGWWISRTGLSDTGGFATKGNIFTANANTVLTGVSQNFYALAFTGILGIAELSNVNPGTVAAILYQSDPFTRAATAGYQSFAIPNIAFTAGKIYCIYFTRTDGTTGSSVPLIYQGSIDNVDPTGSLTSSGYAQKADINVTVSDTLYTNPIAIYNMSLSYSTTNNYQGVQDTYDIDADVSYVSASNVGDYDLYDIGNLPATVTGVSAVNQIVWAKKTDVATRTMNLTTKSGATTTDSTAVTLSTSYVGYNNLYETDPNTAAAWTVSNVNALQIGQKVAS